jgi:histidyl-tRNA synthetase
MVLQWGEESEDAALAVTGRLRRAGIPCEVGYRAGKLGKQIGNVAKRGIPMVLFQGPEEAARGEWNLKILASGEQVTIPDSSLESEVRARRNAGRSEPRENGSGT